MVGANCGKVKAGDRWLKLKTVKAEKPKPKKVKAGNRWPTFTYINDNEVTWVSGIEWVEDKEFWDRFFHRMLFEGMRSGEEL